jgi:lambda family phage minor tail protein L
MTETIKQHIQNWALDPLVELYELDLSPLGSSTIYRFTPMTTEQTTALQFGGQVWQPLPILGDGFQYSNIEAPAKPTLSIANVNKTVLTAVLSNGDLVGAKLTRYRTFRKFLADGSSPDNAAFLPKDVFFVEKKLSHNRMAIQWQLTSALDKMGTKLPKRLFLQRDFPGLSKTRFRT